MKYFKRLQIYKSANLTFNPKTLEAHSYRWWKFVALVEGKVVFNNYRYSNTTSKHQSKVSFLLAQLGIKVDYQLPIPDGIQTGQTLQDLILISEEYLCERFLKEKLRAQDRYHTRKEKLAKQTEFEKFKAEKQNFERVQFTLIQGGA